MGELERALAVLVRRHELLRSRYPTVDGQPRLEIAAQLQPSWPCEDVSTFADPVAEARRRASELAARPFDVARDVLLRAALYRLGQDAHLLVLSLHHLITDAWSMGVFLDELSAFYRAFTSGGSPGLAPLPVQYADFSVWQDEWMNYGVLEELLFYWQQRLRDAPPELALVTDRPAAQRTSLDGANLPFQLEAPLVQRVLALAYELNATPFMVLLPAGCRDGGSRSQTIRYD